MEKSVLNVEWLKCQHGVDMRQHCEKCSNLKNEYLSKVVDYQEKAPKRIPILRGCQAHGGCFCTGRCRDVIGYRDPIYPGER